MARILVVDDEPLIAMLAEEWLVELGHEPVGPAHSLADALQLAQTPIDGAIIDVTLGKDTGYPVAAALAERQVPFAFATGHAANSLASEHKPTLALHKPYEFETFRRAVDSLLAAPRG